MGLEKDWIVNRMKTRVVVLMLIMKISPMKMIMTLGALKIFETRMYLPVP